MSTLTADDPRHGTVNGYANQKCRCQACRDAWCDNVTAKRRERRRRREAGEPPTDPRARTDPAKHNAFTYSNWGCRCDECRAAHSARLSAYKARKRAEARS